jgi:membrane protease YdiL (CAAX protease family)
METRMAFVRRWFAILYGIGFASVLVMLVVYARHINNEMWSALWSSRFAEELSLPVGTIALESLGMVVVLVILGKLIEHVDPRFRPRSLIASNLNFRPLLHRWMRYPFALLFLYNLPVLAMVEEFIFRQGGMGPHPIVSWQDVLVSSLAFGLFHALMSWNLRGGILQMVLGFWFCYQYLTCGRCDPLVHASFSHFMVDLLVFTPGVLQLCLMPRVLNDIKEPSPAL